MYHNNNHKQQACPFIDFDQRMSQGNQETASGAVPFRQDEPMDHTGEAQQTEKDKGTALMTQSLNVLSCFILFPSREKYHPRPQQNEEHSSPYLNIMGRDEPAQPSSKYDGQQ